MAQNHLDWFRNAKLGLFIHFGLYSLLGGCWQGKLTPGLAEWIQNDLNIPAEEYARLAARFDPHRFDAREIAALARDWGMRYLCLTAKHHDGFALFDSKASDFTSPKSSPCKRDLVAEMAQACREIGLVFCVYYSQAQDWHHPGGYRAYHQNDPLSFEGYFETICLPQVRELLTQYGPIGMLWFDTPMEMTPKQCRRLADTVRALQPNCLINGRVGSGLGDYLTTADNRIPRRRLNSAWEVPVTLNHSWGYKSSDQNWVSPQSLLEKLLKVVSRGGNMLANIGPMGDGSLPDESRRILEQVGDFLKKNSQAIYGAEAAQEYVFEFEGMVFTQKSDKLFIHLMDPQKWAGQRLSLYNMGSLAKSARLLASREELPLSVAKDLEGYGHWAIQLPASLSESRGLALVIEVDLDTPVFEVQNLERD